jgi:hypothetical protein
LPSATGAGLATIKRVKRILLRHVLTGHVVERHDVDLGEPLARNRSS